MGRRGNRESEQNRGLEKFGIQKKKIANLERGTINLTYL